MVRSDFLLLNPICNFIFLLVLNVSSHLIVIPPAPMYGRSTSLLASLIHIRVSVRTLREFFEDKKTCKTLSATERSLKDGRINSIAVEQWPMHFESSMTILGQAVLV
jgi:hypothetical protein